MGHIPKPKIILNQFHSVSSSTTATMSESLGTDDENVREGEDDYASVQ